MTKRIFRAIFFVSTVVLMAGLALIMGILYQYFNGQLEKELKNEAVYLSSAVERLGVSALQEMENPQARITLIDESGTVLYDSQGNAEEMDNHGSRQEIKEASETGEGASVRYSKTLSERTVYYAKRLSDGQILRVSSIQYTLFTLAGSMIHPILLIFILLIILAGVFASRAARKIVAPINRMDLENFQSDEDVYEELEPLLSKIHLQQQTIAEQLAEAKRKQEEFSMITENMQEGLLVIDRNSMLLSWNSSALRLMESREIRENQSVIALNRSEEFQEVITTVLTGSHIERTFRVHERFCQLTANPVIQNEKTEGAVLLLVDVTEAVQREQLRREFTANVSHELKTPLTSISGFAEIIRNGMVKKEDIEKFSGKIFDEAQRLIALVEDIIKISQLDEGTVPFEKQELDLYAVSRGVIERLQPLAEKYGVRLQLNGGHAVLNSVPVILDEIIYNLCDNGIKYNHEGGQVTVTVKQERGETILKVADTGIGISEPDKDRIFERFYRVDKSHSKEIGGTGLGLSIVKHGAAYLGAELRCESTLGNGTVFTLKWDVV